MLYKIRKLRRDHGTATILDIDSLDIQPERVYTLIGPNGAGKTTLLNILAFLDIPTSGKMSFCGKSVRFGATHLHGLRQKVSLVDQYPILFTGSVRKNVEYGLKVRNISAKERLRVVEEVLEMVGMARFIEADAHKLSGGETKRVALARALAIEPEVLLCDEPTANVDSENQEIILKILQRCNSRNKVSLIFATHYLSQATRLADHTIILQNGRLSSSRRENVFTAGFVEKSGSSRIYALGDDVLLAVDETLITPQDHHTVFIDPRKLSLNKAEEQEISTPNRWCGTVKKIERVNHSVTITVDCGIYLEALQPLDLYRQDPLHIEDRVVLGISVDPAMFL